VAVIALLGALAISARLAPAAPSGSAWAWGENLNGQLGDGSTGERHLPVKVQVLTSVAAVAAGGWHSFARKTDGTVWAWGYDADGELGDGATADRRTPAQINALTGVTALAGSQWLSLALKNDVSNDGTVWAWGANWVGEVGDGTSGNQRRAPVQVSNLTQVVGIAAGEHYSGSHALAVKADGTVWAWGSNDAGQLGNNQTADSSLPVQVLHPADPTGHLTGVVAVAAGYGFSLALKGDGTVWGWGTNYLSELGDASTAERHTPVQVHKLAGVSAIAARGSHALALIQSDGTVWAWGDNGSGQLGDGTSGTVRTEPVQVHNLAGVIAIAAGAEHSLALKGDGTVSAWGDSYYGQIGDGATSNRLEPVQVHNLAGVFAIAAGWDHSIALVLAPQADLQGCVCTAPATACWGQAIQVACQIKNAGNAAAGPFRIEWYLSQDAVGSEDDQRLSRTGTGGTFYSHAGIAAGAKGPAFSVTLQLPPELPSDWSDTGLYILMRTDSANAVGESDETNNFGQMGDNLDRAPIGLHVAVPQVTYPTDRNEVWFPGKAYTITWKEFLAPNVKIELLKEGALPKTLVASTLNDGACLWTVPATQPIGADYKIKVTSTTDPAITDSSEYALTIALPKVTYPTLAGVAWLGGKSYTVTWSGFPDASVNVDLYQGGVLSRNIATTTPNPGSFPWTVPGDVLPGTDYTVRVSSPTNPNLSDASDKSFTIAQPKVAYPTAAGEVWRGGETKSITWSGFPIGAAVKVQLYKGTALSKTLAAAAPNNGSFDWLVPRTQPAGNDYTVKATSTASALVCDASDNPFTIASPLVKYPTAAGVLWLGGKAYTITWSGFPGAAVKVDLLKGGVLNRTIAASTPNNGSLPWTVPADQAPGLDYTVQVSSLTGPTVSDASDNAFAIAAPKVTYPTAAGVAWLGGTKYTVTWSGFPGANVKVELYKGAALNATLSASTANNGSLDWTVPAGQTVGTDYSVKVSSLDGPTLSDTSDAKVTIAVPKVIFPSDTGVTIKAGTSVKITWSGFPGSAVKIDALQGGVPGKTLAMSAPNSGSFTYAVPKDAEVRSDYTIKITSTANASVFDSSDNQFSVIAP